MIPANQLVAGPGTRLVDKGCASTDFWTPERVLEPVRDYFVALGADDVTCPIHLDPATAPSNPTGARVFWTPKEDGLAQSWRHYGLSPTNVFCNPPYGSALYRWVPKIAEEARASRDVRIVALLPGQRFDQPYWLEHLVGHERLTAVVFVVSRIAFKTPDGRTAKGNPYGSMLWVFNGEWDAAASAFSRIGAVLEPGRRAAWSPPEKARARAAKDFARAQERARQGLLFGAAGRIAAPRPASSTARPDPDPWETATEAAYDAARDHGPGGFPRGGTED